MTDDGSIDNELTDSGLTDSGLTDRPASNEALRDGLRSIVGDANVLTDDDAASLLVDFRGVYKAIVLGVVRPADTAEVSAVVCWCVEHDVAVVTQGGNTGLSGGTSPTSDRPTILLSVQRLNTIEIVDPSGWTMTVQAGVTIQAMHDAAAEADRLFAPDWGARGSATIGGAIATDAGGNNVVRYGNMRDQVMGLEVVLADGQIWNGLRALRKDSSGYDLKQLFIGSEGTLGVITRAVVKLHPANEYEQTAMAALSGLDDLMSLFALAKDAAPDAVVAFELVPEVGVLRACETFDIVHPMETRADFYAIVKLAGPGPVTEQLAAFLGTASQAGLITDAIIAGTPEQEERLWTIRDELPAARLFPRYQKVGLKMDTAVPMGRMAEYHDTVRAIAADVAPTALAYGFGHVGDGNLHMTILPITDDDVEPINLVKDELIRRIDEATFAIGGTLSAEHGVGRLLRDRVAGQKPELEWQMMQTIKEAFDPNGLFNPGALLPDR